MFFGKSHLFLVVIVPTLLFVACGGGSMMSKGANPLTPSASGNGGTPGTPGAPGTTQSAPNSVQSYTIPDIQAMSNWTWCSKERNGGVCAAGLGVAYTSMTQNQRDPSLGGNSTVYFLGGSAPYSNALWWRTLSSSSSPTHFTYDVYFNIDDSSAPEALEFDLNQSYGGVRYTWGTECSYRNTGMWDVWDPRNEKWVTTAVPCKQVSANAWHHLVWQFEKANGGVHYISVQIDGTTSTVDKYFSPQQNWNTLETNVAFQMDGDFRQTPYKVWLDHLNLTSW